MISKAIGNQNLFKQRIDWFSEFFSSIKGLRGKGCLRFVFITGITRYQHTGIGSGLNNVQDVSFDEEYSTLFGYTEDELKRYFGAYIEYGAKRLGMSFDDYLNCLRYEYDGYCFEDTEDDDDYDDGDVVAVEAVDAVDASNAEESTEVTKVYNPWSILKSLQALSAKKVTLAKVMNRFWVDTGSESSFFVNFVRSLLLGLNKEKQQQWFLSFICTDLTADFSLHKSLLSAARSPYTADFSTPTDLVTAFRVAMVQAGYYTLKQLSSQEKAQLKSANEFYCIDGSIPFFLTVPNNEIETYLHYWFWPNLSTFLANELHDMLVVDIQDAKKEYTIVQDVIEERHGSLGRSDIFIAGKLKNAVLELKLDKIDSEDSLKVNESYDKTMQEAIDQIHNKRYYDKAPRRNTLCYAVVFSQKERRVVRVAIFEHSVQDHNSKLAVAKHVVEAAPTAAQAAAQTSAQTSATIAPPDTTTTE